MDKVEQMVKLVEEYKEKQQEEIRIQNTINAYKTDLKHFMDTGNKHIRISFCQGQTYENLYRGEDYPSDAVKEAVQNDIEQRIVSLEKQQYKIHDRILVLRCLIAN